MRTHSHVHSHPLRQPTSGKGQAQIANTSHPSHFFLVALYTLEISARHEISRTNAALRLVHEHPIWAHRLIPVMLKNGGLPQYPSERQRKQCGPREIDHIGPTHEGHQCSSARTPDNSERELGIVHAASKSLRHKYNFEAFFRVCGGPFHKPYSERTSNGLNSAEVG